MSQKMNKRKGKKAIVFGDKWEVKKFTSCKIGGSFQNQQKCLIQ